MEIPKSSGVGGAWVDKKELKNGDLAKLKTEALFVEGANGKQLVAKIRIKGMSEDKNVAINTPTKNALIDAFGTDSLNWVDKLLTVRVESGIFAGKRGVMLNLIPEDFEMSEDDGGYIVIKRKGEPEIEIPSGNVLRPPMIGEDTGDINPDDILF
jgi:hypothetical protein